MANPLGFITNSEFIKRVKHLFNAGGSSGSASAAKRMLTNIVKSKSLALPELGRLNELEGAGSFEFATIDSTYQNESIVRQAIDKYVDLMFKAGWSLTGKNQASVDYIKMRLALIAEGTGIPTEQLLIEMAEDFVLYHNVFVLKVRQPNGYQFPPGIKVTPVNNQMPVVGYFPISPGTITIKRSPQGTVLQYQQEVSGSQTKLSIKPTDMVHMYRAKPRGKAFGVPFLAPVVNDIKLLRIIEELVGKLIYKETFPIYVYTVGTTEMPATDTDIEEAKANLDSMPVDGMLFVPERHKLEVVGSEGKVLNINDYLQYFESRVFTGLGISDTLMGRGSTSSRSTADNLTVQMNDKIKAYQKALSVFVNDKMISEMLVEGGFDPVINPLDAVRFDFKEIDLDNKIKVETHAMQKFMQNGTTWEEMRIEIAMDPVADEGRLFFQMIQNYLAMEAAAAQAKNKVTPSNQYSASTENKVEEAYKPQIIDACALLPKNKIDEYASKINQVLEDAKSDIIDFYKDGANDKSAEFAFSLLTKYISETAYKYANTCFFNAVNSAARQELDVSRSPYIDFSPTKSKLQERFMTPLAKIIGQDLSDAIANTDKSPAEISAAFDLFANRAIYVLRDIGFASYNHGIVALAKKLDIKELFLKKSKESDCELCRSHNNTRIIVSDDLITPPYHNHCTCTFTFKRS